MRKDDDEEEDDKRRKKDDSEENGERRKCTSLSQFHNVINSQCVKKTMANNYVQVFG